MYKAKPRSGLLAEIERESPLQTDYVEPLAAAVRQIRGVLGDTLHSLYISGDIAHRCAGASADFEFTLVTSRALNVQEYASLNTIRWRIEQSSDAVKRVEFDVVPLKEVTALSNIFKWGFFIKHCALCVSGDNLADSFGHFEASWEVSKAMNSDLAGKLKELRQKVAVATKWGTQLDAAEDAAKRLIKAAFGLVASKEGRWEHDLRACADAFLASYPEKSVEIERLFYLIERKPVKKRAVVALMDEFGQWVQSEYARIDRKIG
ncbi:hypothetical protein [Enterovibrio calviensis]|uniref:hypothetical protein n=1 Tax=Enterovibrio calviensis TaxID=91359 RepID=UPI0004845815|nr:hypothetical protein [Enterovibrio calviensis]